MADPNLPALIEACAQAGCPLCRLAQGATERFLDNLFYEMVNDAGMRNQLRNSLGFCKTHTRLLLDTSLRDPLGLSIVYLDVLNKILSTLPQPDQPGRAAGLLDRLLRRLPKETTELSKDALQAMTPRGPCPACHYRDQYTRSMLESLTILLETPNLSQALEASDGLCLPHLRLALEKSASMGGFAKLILIHHNKLQKLRDELAEFIRKSDYRFMGEGFGAEGNAYQRAMEMLVGSE